MPDFWQTPTVSMAWARITAIYQVRFWKYLNTAALILPSNRKIWCFLGDGETDEPNH